jgi:hypothetical protein
MVFPSFTNTFPIESLALQNKFRVGLSTALTAHSNIVPVAIKGLAIPLTIFWYHFPLPKAFLKTFLVWIVVSDKISKICFG